MSAFVVSDKHINTIVSFASLVGAGFNFDGRWNEVRGNEQRVASILYAANAYSVDVRYNEETQLDDFQFRLEPSNHWTHIQILKLIDCLEYQSCEFKDWDTSPAKNILDNMRQGVYRKMPGYENSKWDI